MKVIPPIGVKVGDVIVRNNKMLTIIEVMQPSGSLVYRESTPDEVKSQEKR